MKGAVWSVGQEECSVKCGLWSVTFRVRRVQCEVWTVKCAVWSVKCGVRRVQCEECGVWSAKSAVWRVQCEVCSVECEDCQVRSVKWSFKCDMWNKTPVSQSARTHGLGWRTAHASSIDEKGLIYIYIFKATSAPPRAGTTGNSFKWSEQLAIFRFSPCRMSFGWTTCRCAWLHLFFHEKSGNRTCFRCGFSFFWWSLVRFKCARNSGVDNLSRLQGCDMKAEGLWALSRKMHVMWMHLISSTSSPLVPYLMRAFLSRSGLGPSRS